MLANAGVKRCYGIVGDALNPFIDALRRNGRIDFIQVRNEEYGVFAAVAEAYLTGDPVAVCGTAGPGVVHLFNGLMDARMRARRSSPSRATSKRASWIHSHSKNSIRTSSSILSHSIPRGSSIPSRLAPYSTPQF